MSNSFEWSMFGGPPVNREDLGSGSDNHPHEFMSVALGETNGLVENLDLAIFIDPADKPDLTTTQWHRVNPPHRLGKISQRCLEQSPLALAYQPSSEVAVVGALESFGALPQLPKRAESIPLPDLLLPKSVVALDQGIGSGPSLGGEERNDPAGQTEPDKLSETARMHPPSRQAHIVVHLQKSWDTMALPVSLEKSQNVLDSAIGPLGSTNQARRHILAVQDHHGTLRSQVVPHNEVELVYIVLSTGSRTGQDRPLPRPVPALAGQQLATRQNAMNCADAVQGVDSQVGQLVVDCLRSIESKRICLALELGMDSDDQALEGAAHTSSDLVRSLGAIHKPCLSSVAIPIYPFVDPLPTASQISANPTDGLFLQPQTNASFPFLDQSRSFFGSYSYPPHWWEGIVHPLSLALNCQRCVVSLYVNDVLSCDR